MEVDVRLVQASITAARGDIESAEALWTRALLLAREIRDPQVLGTTLAARAMFLLQAGHREEAATLTDEVLAFRDDEGNALYFTWLIHLAWLVRDLDRSDDVPRIQRAEPWNAAAAAIHRGAFAEAAAILSSSGMRTEEAYARLRAAEAFAEEGRRAEAQAQLERALAFYRSVGASAYVQRAEALLPASA